MVLDQQHIKSIEISLQKISLSRRFQKIDVNEPTVDECITILNGVICEYENYHNVSFSKESIESAVHLSNKYINDKYLSDKAFDVIDETGACINLKRKIQRLQKFQPKILKIQFLL